MSNKQNNKAFSMIADIEGDFSDLSNINMPESMPILAVRNLVLFPGVVSPILIGRESSMTHNYNFVTVMNNNVNI